jgi:hypothetical protein
MHNSNILYLGHYSFTPRPLYTQRAPGTLDMRLSTLQSHSLLETPHNTLSMMVLIFLVNCCWPSPAQSHFVQSSKGLTSNFTVWRLCEMLCTCNEQNYIKWQDLWEHIAQISACFCLVLKMEAIFSFSWLSCDYTTLYARRHMTITIRTSYPAHYICHIQQILSKFRRACHGGT